MKTRIILWAAAMLITQSAFGEVSTNFLFRYRTPIVNDSLRCDLTPLFAWWLNQLEAKTNLLQPTGEISDEGNNDVANRPMAPWFHVTGEILNMNEPQGWVVNAMVETAPGKGTPMKILLIHPPRKEPDRFAQKMSLLDNPPPQPDYTTLEGEIDMQNRRASIANAYGEWEVGDNYLAAAADATHRLEVQKQQDQLAMQQREQTLMALGDFPASWQVYRVDLFALNTGRQSKGMPVFDAGLSFAN
jgi:hypothetical protein